MPKTIIKGLGYYLPERVMLNEECASFLDTSDAWIRERTGIQQRYIANEAESVVKMGTHAAQAAIQQAGISAQEVDMIVVATSSAPYLFPSTACLIQEELGIGRKCHSFDLAAACSGFVYALSVVDAFIIAQRARCALVIGVERMSDLVDWSDRKTCVLFGDGAGAAVVFASSDNNAPGIEHVALGSQGKDASVLTAAKNQFLQMQGPQLFKIMVPLLADFVSECLQNWNLSIDNIDAIIPHQANQRILQALAERLHYPFNKMVSTVAQHSNTSSASIPLALTDALKTGSVRAFDRVLLLGFGGGLTWGAILMQVPKELI
jgi:3-oxoacyl-[acyl-carrier-protein] synthase III